jgi:hypothetical protein
MMSWYQIQVVKLLDTVLSMVSGPAENVIKLFFSFLTNDHRFWKGATTFSRTTLSIMAFGKIINKTWYPAYGEALQCWVSHVRLFIPSVTYKAFYAECHILAFLCWVSHISLFMVSFDIFDVIMLSVAAPLAGLYSLVQCLGLTLELTSGLYYKSFTIVIYDFNDSGQYYQTMMLGS